MTYTTELNPIRKYIKLLSLLLVLPTVLFSVMNIPFGHLFTSVAYIMVFVCFLKFKSFRRLICSKTLLLWLILIVYHYLNGYLKHVPDLRMVDYVHAFKMYSAVCIFSYLFLIDLKATLKYFSIALFIWLIVASCMTGFNAAGRLSGKKIIAVTFGKYSAILCIFIVYYMGVLKDKTIRMLQLCLFPIGVILLSQTRNAFGMVLIQLLGFFYGIKFKGKIKIKFFIPALFIALFTYVSIGYVVNNTALGNRLKDQKSYEYYESKGIATGTLFDKIAGERLVYYVNGFNLFLKHPLTGIGINNYQHVNGGIFPMHVEYMVHLCEGGLMAFGIFALFLFAIFKRIIRMKYERPMFILLTSTFLLQLFTSMYSVSFDQEIPVIIYGFLIAAGTQKLDSPCINLLSVSMKRKGELV